MQEHNVFSIGLDVSDRFSYICELDAEGQVARRERISTHRDSLRLYFGARSRTRLCLEVGPHSPWMSRLLEEMGHEVLVANARKLKLIYGRDRKTDVGDAEVLARVGRLDPTLLSPITHRSAEVQQDLAVIKARDALVKTRTRLINHIRGSAKALGHRVPSCTAKSFHRLEATDLPEELRPALAPQLEVVREIANQIRHYDHLIEKLAKDKYPETEALRQIQGVGAITALAFVLIVQDPARFSRSRDVGAFLGLVPKRDQSGELDRELHITKAGDPLLRRLLVHSAHYILGPFGQDSDLRRFGERLTSRGGKAAKKRAVTAVARKLAVVLHHLWRTGDVYEPLHNTIRSAN